MLFDAEGVEVRYGSRTVLLVERLQIAAGRVLAVMGPNGAGKSTLIHILALLRRPAAGRLRVFGAEAWADGFDATAARRRMGVVMQRPWFFCASVVENVAYALRWRGVEAGEARRRALEELERWGAGHLAQWRATELSGGETVRVALARALVGRPEVLLLDEPTAHLDRATARLVEQAASEWAGRGCAVVMATHDPGFGLRLADQVIHLREGRLGGAPEENILVGRVEPGPQGARFRAGAAEFDVVADISGPAVLVVDPAHVILSARPLESSARNWIRGRISAIEQIGGGRVRVRVEGPVALMAHVTMPSCREMGLTVGKEVIATFKAASVRVV